MRANLMFMPAALVYAAVAPASALDVQGMEAGQAKLFPQATLTPADLALTPDQVERLKTEFNVPVLRPQIKRWKASTGGTLYLDQVYGLNDIVTYLVALDEKGSVKGIEILVCVEGFCDIATTEWRAQFSGRKFGKWDPKTEIANISGATLSAMHVAEGVKKVLAINALFAPKAKS
jgi:hypothetical protein